MHIVIKYWYEDSFGIIVVVKSRLQEIDSSLEELDEKQLSDRFTHPFAKTYVSWLTFKYACNYRLDDERLRVHYFYPDESPSGSFTLLLTICTALNALDFY